MINHFLKVVQKSSDGYVFHGDCSKSDSTNSLDACFTDTGLPRIIDAYYYDNIDMLSLFIGAISDRCCVLSIGKIKTCSDKCEHYNAIFRYGRKPV